MPARSLTAYFSGTLLLLAGMAGSVVAKPPDLPVKVEVNCGPGPSKLVPRVYPVADLVLPLGNHPSAASILLSNAEGAVPHPKLAPPMPVSPECISAPHSAEGCQELRLEAVPGTQLQRYTTSTCDPPCEPPSSPPASEKTQEEQLIKLIMNMIEPASWSQRGGQATLEYFPLGMSLVVNQTPEIQEQIAELLTALRRFQDAEVAVEVRFVTVSDSIYERMARDFKHVIRLPAKETKHEPQLVSEQLNSNHVVRAPSKETACPHGPVAQEPAPACPCNSPCVIFLNDREVFQFMEAVQGDPRTNIMQAPKMTVFNGQISSCSVNDQHFFVTSGVKELRACGQSNFVVVPQSELVTTGFDVAVQPVISADRRFVRLNLKAKQTSLDPVVPLFPITTFVTPVFEGGAIGQPVPFTQYLQQPKVNKLEVEKTLSIPDGGTVLLGGWKRPCTRPHEEPGVLSKIPYVNRLFKNVGYGQETEQVMLMVTPRIIINEEEEVRQVPGCSTPSGPVASQPMPPPCPVMCLPVAPPPAPMACPAPCPTNWAPPPPDFTDSDIILLVRTIISEYEQREQAQKTYRKAERYRHKGKIEAAQEVYEEVRDLFPDTVYAQAAARHLRELHPKLAMREHEGGVEEQDEPPCCRRGGDNSSCAVDRASQKQVSKLVDRYHQACAEGRLADAQKLAGQALAINPACFSKHAKTKAD